MQRLKISREGIVLIKSFEGFRPRAIRRDTPDGAGQWVIGYGHTLSAREGSSVSEAEAELLLQYDLIPVARAVNAGVNGAVNQHQFDALASFAFSVGVERFLTSDVLQRLNAGAAAEAAEAMTLWPEPVLPEAALRRRAAERALFVADPAWPVALSDLLAAPLPPPPVPALAAAPDPAPEPAPELAEPAPDARASAVASLLGESETSEAAPDTSVQIPVFASSAETPVVETEAEVAAPETASEAEGATSPKKGAPVAANDESPTPEAEIQPEPDAERETGMVGDSSPVIAAAESGQPSEPDAVVPELEVEPEAAPEPAPQPASGPSTLTTVLSLHRYSPYSASIVGPLADLAVAEASEPAAGPDAGTAAPISLQWPPVTTAAEAPQGIGQVLVLTPLAEDSVVPAPRLVWPTDESGGDSGQPALFDEDAGLDRDGPVVRHEAFDDTAPQRLNWGETGAYLVMGGFGLVSFGMSMAAFRLASQQSGGSDETVMIAWVLAVIGAACVGVSAWNLYRRWGRTDQA